MNVRDRILQMVCLEEVVERYLPLSRKSHSAKTLIGLCPFHADKHPSLHVNVKDQYYKCFACGEGGDLFKFVQKIEGCGFRGALEKLAGWYGLSDAADNQPIKYPPVKKKLLSVKADKVEPVNPILLENLLRNHRMILGLLKEHIPANEVLREAYKTFEVGDAPSSFPRDYKSLCNRLVFPIRNEHGVLVAFSGRYRGDTKGTDIRKYINSSNSPVYHKSEILYGLYQAQEAIRKHGFVYITEGYKDVLAMHAAGFRNTVALCGTALTQQHVTLLKQYTRRVVVMLDGDKVGVASGARSATLLSDEGFTVGQIILQPEHDPDSLLAVMGYADFIGYMKSATRFSRLEAYESDLLRRERELLSELTLALTPSERTILLSPLVRIRKRLGKVSGIVGHSPVFILS